MQDYAHSCTMWRLFAEIEHLQSRTLYFSEEQREGNKLEKHLYNLYIIFVQYCARLSPFVAPFVAMCHRGYKRSSAAGYFFQNVLGCILMAAVARRAASFTTLEQHGTTYSRLDHRLDMSNFTGWYWVPCKAVGTRKLWTSNLVFFSSFSV